MVSTERGHQRADRLKPQSHGKQSACNAGDPASIPGLGRFPGEGNGNPLQYSCLENPHGQRNLAGYSAWAHKELDTIEPLTHTHIEFEKQKIKTVCVN